MKVSRIEDFKNGWFIGNFDPSVLKTKEFEVGIMQHKKGEIWPCHYHTGLEINYVVSGHLMIQKKVLQTGDIFILEPYEVADPEFLTDCTVVVIKTPSVPGDKFWAEKPTTEKRL